jgi:hypothetical protein
MSDTITPTVGIQTGNTQIRVEGEIGAPANPPPGQTPGSQLNNVGVSATTLNGDNTVTNFGVKVGTDPTNRSFEVNASFGPRTDGEATPYTTQSVNPISGQPVELPGIRNVYPQPNGNTTLGAGVMVTGTPQVLQQPTPENPNAQVLLGQPYAGAGVAVNLNNGDTAGNLVGGYGVIAPGNGGPVPGINLGAQLQVDKNGARLSPDVNVYGTNPPPMDAPFDSVRFGTPQTQEQGRAFDPQAALDTLRRGPEYNQALTALQQNGHPLNPAPDSATDRLAVGIAIAAQENKAQINSVDFGNTIVNAQGNADRNVFYGGQNNSGLRISEQQTINTPVTDQINQANQQKTPDNTQTTPDRQIDQPTIEPRQRM